MNLPLLPAFFAVNVAPATTRLENVIPLQNIPRVLIVGHGTSQSCAAAQIPLNQREECVCAMWMGVCVCVCTSDNESELFEFLIRKPFRMWQPLSFAILPARILGVGLRLSHIPTLTCVCVCARVSDADVRR